MFAVMFVFHLRSILLVAIDSVGHASMSGGSGPARIDEVFLDEDRYVLLTPVRLRHAITQLQHNDSFCVPLHL